MGIRGHDSRRPATVVEAFPYDPENAQLKA